MEEIKFVNINRFHQLIWPQLHEAAARVIDSGIYIGGPEVRSFEEDMARWLGVEKVCGAGSGTSALYAILKGLGVGPGDEVITTVHTAIATAEAISQCGAVPIFCDLEPGYFFLSTEEVAKKINSKTKALLPVHLYGQPVDMDGMMELAHQHGLPLIEDCAQAQGARYRGKYVGTMGDAAEFSFFPSKNLGGFGDGGAFTAKDPAKFNIMKMFSNHGRKEKYTHEFEGINSRLDAIQAAMLKVCLPHLDEWNSQRRRVAQWYGEALGNIKEVVVPQVLPGTEPIYHVYVILVPDRDGLQKFLKEKKISTGVHYPMPLSLQKAYSRYGLGVGSFPRAEYACAHMLSLPMDPSVTKEEVERVAMAIEEYIRK